MAEVLADCPMVRRIGSGVALEQTCAGANIAGGANPSSRCRVPALPRQQHGDDDVAFGRSDSRRRRSERAQPVGAWQQCDRSSLLYRLSRAASTLSISTRRQSSRRYAGFSRRGGAKL